MIGAMSGSSELALVLSRTEYREADWIVTLFTDQSGKVSALARGARKSRKRFGGSLEPLHTLRVEFSSRGGGELYTLHNAQIERPRAALLEELGALSAAGRALSWVRRAAPNHTPEPVLWHALGACLDALSQTKEYPPGTILGAFGLRMLETLGWGLGLTACVVCGKPCPHERAAWINPERGGLVCRACGGGPFKLTGQDREHLAAAALGLVQHLHQDVSDVADRIVERALGAHLGLDDGDARQTLG